MHVLWCLFQGEGLCPVVSFSRGGFMSCGVFFKGRVYVLWCLFKGGFKT